MEPALGKLLNLKKVAQVLCIKHHCRFLHRSYVHNRLIKEVLKLDVTDNPQISAKGWVRAVREHKDIAFLQLTDGTTHQTLQVVASPHLIRDVTYGSCVSVDGHLKASAGKGQGVELVAKALNCLGACDPVEFPFKARKHHPADYVRQHLHLRPRTATFGSLLRLRNSVSQAMHHFFQQNDFCEIHTPIITSNDCEGAGEIFQVEPSKEAVEQSENREEMKNFFDTAAYLTVSSQLHLEVIAGAFAQVYTISPTFRAENSRGRHHLSEFYMVEAEMSFIQHTEQIAKLVEDLLKFTASQMMEKSPEDVDLYLKRVAPAGHQEKLEKLINKSFLRLSYTEAVSILEKSNKHFKYPVKWGCDLQKEHERHLVEHCDNIPVFVTDYPTDIKPFYARQNEDRRTVSAVDLLCSDVGEVCGGSLREERLDVLQNKLDALGIADRYQWYLDLRRFGSAPHGGFGIGFERVMQALLGISNIKDAIPFPRSTHNCKM